MAEQTFIQINEECWVNPSLISKIQLSGKGKYDVYSPDGDYETTDEKGSQAIKQLLGI